MMRQVCGLCMVIASVLTSVARAEYRVNARTSDDQTDAAVAMDADGNHLVVWSSYRQDGDSGGIFAQRFDPQLECVRIDPVFGFILRSVRSAFDDQFQDGDLLLQPQIPLPVSLDPLQCSFKKANNRVRFLNCEELVTHSFS